MIANPRGDSQNQMEMHQCAEDGSAARCRMNEAYKEKMTALGPVPR